MVAIPVQRFDLYLRASQLLQRYCRLSVGFRPVGVEVALAMQHARDRLPWVGDGRGIPLVEVARQICDPFFTKQHPQLPTQPNGEPLVWPLFNTDERGIPQPILPQVSSPHYRERRWLKACNGQAGIGCHAVSAHMWRDEEFLNGDRDSCPLRFYDGQFPMTVDQGRQRCRFDDHPCGWQAGFPKLLQVLGSGPQAEVFRVDWSPAMWGMLIPQHRPIPVYPLLVALYFGNELLQQGRKIVPPEQIGIDLDVGSGFVRQLFDFNPDAALNRPLLELAAQPALVTDTLPWTGETLTPSGWSIPQLLPQPAGGHVLLDPDAPPDFRRSGIPIDGRSDPLLAERRRRRQLERTPEHNELLRQFRRWFRLAGLEVREDQQFFDFLAVKDNRVLLAEVKLLYHHDLAESIQELVGQLFYYERFALTPWVERGYTVLKAAVVNRPLLGEYVDFLADLGIATFWLTETGAIDGDDRALRLLRQMDVPVRPDPELLEAD